MVMHSPKFATLWRRRPLCPVVIKPRFGGAFQLPSFNRPVPLVQLNLLILLVYKRQTYQFDKFGKIPDIKQYVLVLTNNYGYPSVRRQGIGDGRVRRCEHTGVQEMRGAYHLWNALINDFQRRHAAALAFD